MSVRWRDRCWYTSGKIDDRCANARSGGPHVEAICNAEESRLEGRRPEALAEGAAESRDLKPGDLDHAAVQVAVGERSAEALVVVGVGVVVALDEPDSCWSVLSVNHWRLLAPAVAKVAPELIYSWPR